LNDDGFSPTFQTLEALGSPALDRYVTFAGPVHINADFYDQTSDDDPLLACFNIPAAS
jgi:hypothetical protein